MDEGLSRAVRVAFVRMYEAGLIYRGERLVNWCPTDRTGLSDSEVEHEDVAGELITFRYPLTDGSGAVLPRDIHGRRAVLLESELEVTVSQATASPSRLE